MILSSLLSMNDDAAEPDVHAETEAFGASAMSNRPGQSRPARPDGGIATLRLEHYTVLTREDGSPWELGRGAMGITYKAFDTRLHCSVALKVIHSALLQERPVLRERFLREARIAARVRHPNIASVFHLGETAGGDCFYVMELIEGETLAELVRRRGPLPAALVLDIAGQVAQALVAAGQAEMVHRDLKPANIMLAPGSSFFGRSGRRCAGSRFHGKMAAAWVKVIDFGLARSGQGRCGRRTAHGDGRFHRHAAIRQPRTTFRRRGTHRSSRSDIFSLGATLWFLLTTRHPFSGRSLEEIYRQQLRPPPLAAAAGGQRARTRRGTARAPCSRLTPPNVPRRPTRCSTPCAAAASRSSPPPPPP